MLQTYECIGEKRGGKHFQAFFQCSVKRAPLVELARLSEHRWTRSLGQLKSWAWHMPLELVAGTLEGARPAPVRKLEVLQRSLLL